MTRGRHQGIQGFTGRPLDLDERITLKLGEIAKLLRLAEKYPNEDCYRLAAERAKQELHTIQTLAKRRNP